MLPRSNPSAMLALRWIDQRLREVVLHYQRIVESVSNAFDERHPKGSLDPHERRDRRRKLALVFNRERARTIAEADDLLAMRGQLGTERDGVSPVPTNVLGELASIRRENHEYLTKLAAELDWLESQIEYATECQRCFHDGDVRPDPADYDIDGEPKPEEVDE